MAHAFLSFALVCSLLAATVAHEAKDFDDSILYKINFEAPDLLGEPELSNQLRTFYTHEKEKYECVIPALEAPKEEEKSSLPELSPIALLQPIFTAPTCSYRIEAYWSYEICHGHHVRQYHEEREGKSVKFQEYYLGKWNDDKTELLTKTWQAERKNAGKNKYKTLKIDNTRYPYFEMEFNDGTMCDIVNAPRTTMVRYVCYPHGKDDIYSFKETSSCNYEAIILTSVLCVIPAFHPEESKEISIKCFNSLTEPHKPLSMLRQELNEWQDLVVSKEIKSAFKLWQKTDNEMVTLKHNADFDKMVQDIIANGESDVSNELQQQVEPKTIKDASLPPINDWVYLWEFVSARFCLTGGSGWWKYEFCYGKHVRQFHKDKTSEVELYLGFFSETAHRQWVDSNPDKSARRRGFTHWQHYEKGTYCERTGLLREVDVKLTCTPVATSSIAVSMYLLEPKTCQYILFVESPIICDLMHFVDERGILNAKNIQMKTPKTPATESAPESTEHIRS